MARNKTPLKTPVGTRDLCAWQPDTGMVWVQTRNPKFAERLARLKDSWELDMGGPGVYPRTFDFDRPLSWAIRLIARYTGAEKATNEALGGGIAPETNRSAPIEIVEPPFPKIMTYEELEEEVDRQMQVKADLRAAKARRKQS